MSEIPIRSATPAFPVKITEEMRNVGTGLSAVSALMIFDISLLVLAWFVSHSFYQSNLSDRTGEFSLRVTNVYAVTLAVSALTLDLFGQFPLLKEPAVAIKRMIIVALPASFCATVVDSLR